VVAQGLVPCDREGLGMAKADRIKVESVIERVVVCAIRGRKMHRTGLTPNELSAYPTSCLL
jgi:hypothetical protein